MMNFIIVVTVAYIGICVGTCISITKLKVNVVSKILMAFIAPVPIFVILVWAASSVAREKFKSVRDYLKYPLLLAMSLAMYADAIAILTYAPKKKSKTTYIITYRYKVPMIRKAVANSYAVA